MTVIMTHLLSHWNASLLLDSEFTLHFQMIRFEVARRSVVAQDDVLNDLVLNVGHGIDAQRGLGSRVREAVGEHSQEDELVLPGFRLDFRLLHAT